MYQRRWQNGADNATTLNEAYRLAKRAVELEGNESTCFAMLGLVCLFRQSHDEAIQCMRRAVDINPSNQWTAADMGVVLTHCEQPEAALAWFERAREIDPYFKPPWYSFCVGMTNMVLRRYREALISFERVPVRTYRAAALMAGCHARLAEAGQAATLVGECLNLRPKLRIGAFMAKEPFKSPAHAVHLAECLQMAGLPE
jgi:tetratricopeptide (TPR) repeat protein